MWWVWSVWPDLHTASINDVVAFARDAVVFIVYTVILNKMIDMEMCIKNQQYT